MAKKEEPIKEPEQEIRLFDHQEVLAELLRAQGIHEGRWQLVFELGHVATNINAIVKEGAPPVLMPAGMVLIKRIGIAQSNEVNELTVEADAVNPVLNNRPLKKQTNASYKTVSRKTKTRAKTLPR